MRSIAFFLVVFTSLMLILYWVVDRSPEEPPAAAPAPSTTAPASTGEPARSPSSEKGNLIQHTFYDVEKGRQTFRLSGYLKDDLFQTTDLQNFDHVVLTDGEIVIPLQDEQAKQIPAVDAKRPSQFSLTFAVAEYQRIEKSRVKRQETIRLTKGGKIVADDGTLIQFEDMDILINQDKTDKIIYEFKTAKPISLQDSLFFLESPSGLEGKAQKDKEITIRPPVYSYLDSQAARLFTLKAPGAGSGEKIGEKKAAGSGEKSAFGEKSGAQASEKTGLRGKIAVTSQGPLVLALSKEKHTIEFQKEVLIFPVEAITPGKAPAPEDTWFRAQKLAMVIEDGEGLPVIREAAATWEGGRVQAFHRGYFLDGDSLRWRNLQAASGPVLPPGAQSEAVLTGQPVLKSDKIQLRGERAVFNFAESRAVLDQKVEGTFWLNPEVLKRKASKDGNLTGAAVKKAALGPGGDTAAGTAPLAASPKTVEAGPAREGSSLPQRWHFQADQVEVQLAKDFAAHPKESILAFIARCSTDDGLILNSLADDSKEPGKGGPAAGPFELRGRTMAYDGGERLAALEGAPEKPPTFSSSRSRGTSRKIFLREDFLRLDRDVLLDLDLADLSALEKGKLFEGGPGSSQRAKEPPGSPPRAALGSRLQVASDQLDVHLNPDHGVKTVLARSLGEKPIELKPAGGEVAYVLKGPALVWDQETQTALMEAAERAEDRQNPAMAPRLLFSEGMLTARKIRFDKKSWTAYLDGGVEIQGKAESGKEGEAPAPAPNPASNPLSIRAERAEVEFYPELEALGPPEEGRLEELRRVRRLHAWGSKEDDIEISGRSFSATAHEAAWSSETRELRLFGEGRQVFHGSQESREGTLEAEEIVYKRAENVIEFRRKVSGWVRLEDPSRGPRPGGPAPATATAPATAPSALSDSVLWKFSTHALEAKVQKETEGKGLEIASLSAHENVALIAEDRGLELHGDDLEYDRQEQRIRVFSREGRYQTLTNTQEVTAAKGEKVLKTDKIDAREINLWYLEAPDFNNLSSAAKSHVVVEFKQDVTAAFWIPKSSASLGAGEKPKEAKEGAPREHLLCKLRSDALSMRLVPGRDRRRMVELARAEGNVDFTLGEMRAMASEAVLEEEEERLTMRGDGKQNVRLFDGERTIEKPEFVITQIGSKIRLEWKSSLSDKSPLPPGFFRPDAGRR
ncbi:MAG: hypothetical protein HY717_23820 [Planctomycetes bacterium]|nr:hypothetical protein [Planctomycetota bacterium]